MAQLELSPLTRAEALFDAGKLDEAYVILKNLMMMIMQTIIDMIIMSVLLILGIYSYIKQRR